MFTSLIKPYIDDSIDIIDNYKIKNILKYSICEGKCIRGFITKYIMNKLSNNKYDNSLPIFVIESLHTLSLILDDLPCMDNSKMRRNKISSHIKFSEAETILTSAYVLLKLQSEIIEQIYDLYDIENIKNINDIELYFKGEKINRKNIKKIVNETMNENIILGQLLDLGYEYEFILNKHSLSKFYDKDTMIIIYKTSSLFSLSFLLGVIFSKKEGLDLNDFYMMGLHYGILYQIVDDLIDYNEDFKKNYNYVREVGIDKIKDIYNEHKIKLLYLLKKYDLFNKDFTVIIDILDKKFYNNFK